MNFIDPPVDLATIYVVGCLLPLLHETTNDGHQSREFNVQKERAGYCTPSTAGAKSCDASS